MEETTNHLVDEHYLSVIRRQLSYITSDERLEIWGKIMDGYCRNCGDYVGDKTCHCKNDD